MNPNLKDFPKLEGPLTPNKRAMLQWAKDFKKALRENKPLLTCPVCPKSGCPLKREVLGKEA